MNIKKAIEKIYQISTEHCEQDLKNVKINMWDLKRILEALDETKDTCFHNDGDFRYGCVNLSHKFCNQAKTIEMIDMLQKKSDEWMMAYHESEDKIKKLNADLAIANGIVKNLEEHNKNLEEKVSNYRNNMPCYWKGGVVAFKEYDELNSNYKKVKEIAHELDKRLQNVKGILYPNPEKGN